MFRRAALAAMLLIVLATASVSGATHQVNIFNFGFTPQALKIKVGESAKWHNTTASTTHTSTADLFALWNFTLPHGSTSPNVSFAHPGSFAYHCNIHSQMHGLVNVKMKTSAKSGTTSTTFVIRVGTANAPSGFIADIQRHVGSARFAAWISTTAQTVNFSTTTLGTWQFRARLRRISDSVATGFSPLLTITVN